MTKYSILLPLFAVVCFQQYAKGNPGYTHLFIHVPSLRLCAAHSIPQEKIDSLPYDSLKEFVSVIQTDTISSNDNPDKLFYLVNKKIKEHEIQYLNSNKNVPLLAQLLLHGYCSYPTLDDDTRLTLRREVSDNPEAMRMRLNINKSSPNILRRHFTVFNELYTAIYLDHIKTAKTLLETYLPEAGDSLQADFGEFKKGNLYDANENLRHALQLKSPHCAQLFIDHGALVDGKNHELETPLFWTVSPYPSATMTKLLLDNGADIHARNDLALYKSLMMVPEEVCDYADQKERACILKILLEHGASINNIQISTSFRNDLHHDAIPFLAFHFPNETFSF